MDKFSQHSSVHRPNQGHLQDDEISLYEIANTLFKRKKIIVIMVFVFFVAGLAFAVMKEKKYLYTVGIELGSIDGETTTMIGSPETIKQKLQVAYIPEVITKYRLQNPNDLHPYKMDVEFGKGSKLITLKSKDKESLATIYQQLQQNVVDRLIQDHQQKLSVPRNNIQMEYEQASIELDRLKKEQEVGVEQKKLKKVLLDHQFALQEYQNLNLFKVKEYTFLNEQKRRENALEQQTSQSQFYLSQIDRFKKDGDLLRQEVVALRRHIKSAVDREQRAVSSVSGEQNAMLLMLLGKEIHDYRSRLVDLEERLNITVENNIAATRLKYDASVLEEAVKKKEVAEVKAQLVKMYIVRDEKIKQLSHQVDLSSAEIQQQQLKLGYDIDNQQKVYRQLSQQLEGVQDTQALALPMKSDQPVGLRKMLVVAIALVAGSILGVLTALVAEAFSQSKQAAMDGAVRESLDSSNVNGNYKNVAASTEALASVLADAERLSGQKRAS